MQVILKISAFVLLASFSFSGFSQKRGGKEIVIVKADEEINWDIDNWHYWVELAELGLIPFNSSVPPPPAVFLRGSGKSGRKGEKSGPYDNTDILLSSGKKYNISENSIFVNPLDKKIALAANNTRKSKTEKGTNVLFTFDGGATWTGGPGNDINDNRGDPATSVNLQGVNFVGTIDSLRGQVVHISSNNGISWTKSTIASKESAARILDKNHLWVDNSSISPFEGNLYAAWTDFDGSNDGEIEFSRSTDGGLTWSTHFAISEGVMAGAYNQGVNIQTGHNGEVYVTWIIMENSVANGGVEKAIGFTRSLDGGVTFSTAVRIHNDINGIRYVPSSLSAFAPNETGKNMGQNSFPSMAVDISGGPFTGNIYIVWANHGVPSTNTGTDVSIYMIMSSDDGSTWFTPTRVNQDAIGHKQYFSWITCDPTTGDLSVIFYDDRNVGGDKVETWVAISNDAGTIWEDFRVSDVSFTPKPISGAAKGYMGDYLGISSRGGKVYPVWTDNRSGRALSYTSPFDIECVNYRRITEDVLSGQVDHQEAVVNIVASDTVFSDAEALYFAGEEVLLVNNFTVEENCVFRALITECNGIFIGTADQINGDGVSTEDIDYVKAPKPKLTKYFDTNQESSALLIYPNPTADIFNVQLDNDIDLDEFRINIYSMSAGLVYSNQFRENNTSVFEIDISLFSNGIYFIELIDDKTQEVFSGKIVKK